MGLLSVQVAGKQPRGSTQKRHQIESIGPESGDTSVPTTYMSPAWWRLVPYYSVASNFFPILTSIYDQSEVTGQTYHQLSLKHFWEGFWTISSLGLHLLYFQNWSARETYQETKYTDDAAIELSPRQEWMRTVSMMLAIWESVCAVCTLVYGWHSVE